MIRSIRQDRRAVTAVEFAVVLPAMLSLICGAIEMGHMIFARVALEGAVVEAARAATASLETAEGSRTAIMEASIRETMSAFPLAANQSITIETQVFRDFSSVTPETFDDTNRNGRYDLGEAYTDRNRNGKWDPSTPIAGTLGGPGDVVSYSAVYPKPMLFRFLTESMGFGGQFTLRARTVMRNEAVVRRL